MPDIPAQATRQVSIIVGINNLCINCLYQDTTITIYSKYVRMYMHTQTYTYNITVMLTVPTQPYTRYHTSSLTVYIALLFTLHSPIGGTYSKNTNAVVSTRFQVFNVEGCPIHYTPEFTSSTHLLPSDIKLKCVILKTRVVMLPGYIDASNIWIKCYIVRLLWRVCAGNKDMDS